MPTITKAALISLFLCFLLTWHTVCEAEQTDGDAITGMELRFVAKGAFSSSVELVLHRFLVSGKRAVTKLWEENSPCSLSSLPDPETDRLAEALQGINAASRFILYEVDRSIRLFGSLRDHRRYLALLEGDGSEGSMRLRCRLTGKQWLKLYLWNGAGVERLKFKPLPATTSTQKTGSTTMRLVEKWHRSCDPSCRETVPSRWEKGPGHTLLDLTDPVYILEAASNIALGQQKGSATFVAFGKGQCHVTTVNRLSEGKANKRPSNKISVEIIHDHPGSRIMETLPGQYVTVTVSSKACGAGKEPFYFLGLERDITIQLAILEIAGRQVAIPTRIEGESKGEGRMELELVEAKLYTTGQETVSSGRGNLQDSNL